MGGIGKCNHHPAKAPSVGRLRDDSVVRGHSANLTCTFDGSPAPSVTWMKNDKAIDPSSSRNIRIHTRRVRIRTRIRRPRRRRRRRVSRRRGGDRGRRRRIHDENDGDKIARRRKARRRKISRRRSRPVRVISTLSFKTSRDIDEGVYSCVGKSVLGEASARAGLSVVPPLDPGVVYPCPYDSYCLNGGTCMFFKHFGEFVCQCAEGYKGQRCQEKEVFPTFRDHNCRGSLPFVSPSRGLRCPRNHPVFLWEILQQSLAARRQKVTPWTKAQHIAWFSPPNTPAGVSWPPNARLPGVSLLQSRRVGSEMNMTHLPSHNSSSSSSSPSSSSSLIPQDGQKRRHPFLPGTIFPVFPQSLNASWRSQPGNTSLESLFPSLIGTSSSSVVQPTLPHSRVGLFRSNISDSFHSFSNLATRPSQLSNNIPKSNSGQRKIYGKPPLKGNPTLRNKKLLPDSRPSLQVSNPYLDTPHTVEEDPTSPNSSRQGLNKWPIKPPSVQSVPRHRYAYPTALTPPKPSQTPS